jgi:hypothetical protein
MLRTTALLAMAGMVAAEAPPVTVELYYESQ